MHAIKQICLLSGLSLKCISNFVHMQDNLYVSYNIPNKKGKQEMYKNDFLFLGVPRCCHIAGLELG